LDREKTVYTELSMFQNSTHYQSSKTALIINHSKQHSLSIIIQNSSHYQSSKTALFINHPNIAAALTTSSHPFILSSLT